MKICIDIQTAINKPTGVGHYTIELVKNLAKNTERNDLILFYINFKRKRPQIGCINATYKTFSLLPERLVRRMWYYLKWPSFNTLTGAADIFHFPDFVIPPLKNGKSVVTIHDMSFLRFPEYAPNRYAKYLTNTIQDTAMRADTIVTDSLFSKQEIESLLSIDSSRLHHVYPGISSNFYKRDRESIRSVLTRFKIDRPYILLVATVEPRKNIPFIINVFEKLKGYDGCLVIAGRLGWKYEPIIKHMKNSPKTNSIHYIEYVNDDDLPALYSGADLFVFPSYYEGFGLPPLEAMACGIPVVSSAGGSLQEVLDGGACIIYDFNHDTWLDEITKLLFDSAYKTKRIAAGYNLSRKYTWAKCASQILQIYRTLT
jgi:glycosyltransferase involved in cell wall biosynthesis